MDFSRRRLMGATALGAVLLPLAGCQSDGIPVTLAGAQQEAGAILTAVEDIASNMSLTASQSLALQVAKTIVPTFQAIQPGQPYQQTALKVVSDLTPLLSLIPMAPETMLAVRLGMGLISAFAAGQSSVPAAPVAAAAVFGAAPIKLIGATAPIPIPVPVS